MRNDLETVPTVAGSLLRRRPRPAITAFREDQDVSSPGPASADDRAALIDRLEGDAVAGRFRQLDRRSEELAAQQQRTFAQRLDAAIAAELALLRQRRQDAAARLDAWEQRERARITADLAAQEQRFGERLMTQLDQFEAELAAGLHEQEIKLGGWWREAERLADQRTRAAIQEIETTPRI